MEVETTALVYRCNGSETKKTDVKTVHDKLKRSAPTCSSQRKITGAFIFATEIRILNLVFV
jgi:hypothetical protein